jgi:hypothetical protein
MDMLKKTNTALWIGALLGCTAPLGYANANAESSSYAVRTAITGEQPGKYFGMTMTNIGKFSDKDIPAAPSLAGHTAGEDIAIAAPYAEGDRGAVYVIFGTSGGQPMQSVTHVGEFDPQNALKIFHSNTKNAPGSVTTNRMGWAVKKIGDLNKDGYDDLVIASHWLDQVYVIWGGAHHRTGMARLSNQIDLNNIDNGDNSRGIRIRTVNANGTSWQDSWFGTSIGAIDYNQDHATDLAIGDIHGVNGRGGVAVIFGSKTEKPAAQWSNIDLKRDNAGNWDVPQSVGAFIRPEDGNKSNVHHPINRNLGSQVGNVGDINGDGKDDYLVMDSYSVNEGRRANNSGADGHGTGYLIYGSSFQQGKLMDLASLNATQATRIHGMLESFIGASGNPSNYSSYGEAEVNNGTISALGNFSSESVNSFAISAPVDRALDNKRSGLVWVLKGVEGGRGLNNNSGGLFLDAAYDRVNYNKSFSSKDGFAIYANRPAGQLRGFGQNIIGNVDVNGDGHMDLVISDPNAMREKNRVGAVYVVYGGNDFNSYMDEDAMINIEDLLNATVNGKNVADVYWGKNTDEKFGSAIAVGDFNGDKVDDLAIGTYRDTNYTGKVTFVMGESNLPN